MSKVERHLFIGVSSKSPSSFFRRHILLYKPDITWPRIILRTDGMMTDPETGLQFPAYQHSAQSKRKKDCPITFFKWKMLSNVLNTFICRENFILDKTCGKFPLSKNKEKSIIKTLWCSNTICHDSDK